MGINLRAGGEHQSSVVSRDRSGQNRHGETLTHSDVCEGATGDVGIAHWMLLAGDADLLAVMCS